MQNTDMRQSRAPQWPDATRPMIRIFCLQGVIAAAFVLALSDVGAAADLVRGRGIALRWCSECHVVASGQGHGSDAVPTFAQISGSEHLDEARLSGFLANPQHSQMPNFSLTRSEIADLVAYIKAQHR
jgi:mono/diheme cytochrome c family protein